MRAFKRTPQGPRRRSGAEFFEDKVTLVENPTEAQLADPGLTSFEVSGPNDPQLANLKVYVPDAPPEPEAPTSLDPQQVNDYVEAQGGVIVTQKDFDAFNGESERLQGEVQRLEKAVEDLERDLQTEKTRRTESASRHGEDVKELKAKHAKALEDLSKQHAEEVKDLKAKLNEAKKDK